MLTVHMSDKVSPDMACSILNYYSKESIGVFIDLERCLEYQVFYTKTARPLLLEWRKMANSANIVPTERRNVRDILINTFHVPELKIMTTQKEDIEVLINDDSISQDARHFTELFKDLSKYYQRISSLEQFIRSPVVDALSFEGKRMVRVRPDWNILATGRLSSSQPTTQNISKDMLDIITYLPSQKLYSADSGQIEPKITYSHYIKDPLIKYLILLYGDAYYGLTHFVLMSDAQEKQARDDMSSIVKMEITADLADKRSKIKTLALSTNYGGEEFAKTIDLGTPFIYKVKNHYLRTKIQEQAKYDIQAGARTFYTAFGSPVTPKGNAKYKENSLGWINHLQRCAINNPIQGTAADLMNISVYNANKIIKEEARSPLTSICCYVHDAGLFYVAEKDDKIADKLMECMSYQVIDDDGIEWIPINCDKIEGKRPCK